jgi:hypothetical protein
VNIIVVYCVILLLVSGPMMSRRNATLVQGRLFAKFNAVCFGLIALWLIIVGMAPSRMELLFVAAMLAASLYIRDKWLLFKYNGALGILEESAEAILLPFKKTVAGYDFQLGANVIAINVSAGLPHVALIRFLGNWRLKKAVVLKNLLVKRIQGVLPRFTIHLN